ncbi:PDZ domain-containing protein 8-like isoform X2 [Ornithodoros turicata]|uniref:PDZ domain-containing protein 8-like isoform X2 n=1 Tax=Ornithodoros turicata TaxID=34597 RepID=UPI003138ABE7
MSLLLNLAVFSCFFLGVATPLFLLAYAFYQRFTMPAQQRPRPQRKFAPLRLPQKLLDSVVSGNWKRERETVIVGNLLMQAMFREWNDTGAIRRIVTNRLSKGFADALSKKAGKVFERIELCKLDFGNEAPTLTKIAVEKVILHEMWKTIEQLDVFVSGEYAGGFTLAVDAVLKMGSVASLFVKVTHVSGKVRLQFARRPYSHWSFAFYEEPKVVISVESSLQGKNLPQVANIVMSLIRRVIRKKHTLPIYKIRFKPFILLPELRINPPARERVHQSGPLEITVVQCSRLMLCEGSFQLYCMLSLDDSQWIDMDKVVGTPWVTLELDFEKPKYVSPGVELKQAVIEGKFRVGVIVDSVTPDSPFDAAQVKVGDVLIAIKNHPVVDMNQALRILNRISEPITIKVERKLEFDWNTFGKEHATNKPAEGDAATTEDAKPKSPFAKKGSIANLLTGGAGLKAAQKKVGDSTAILERARARHLPIKRTAYVLSTTEPVFLQEFNFEVRSAYKYINVGIWSKGQIVSFKGVKKPRVDTMLAYTSIPLAHVLEECKKTTEGYHGQVVKLLCPEFTELPKDFASYSSLSGFDPRLCYGDITLRFFFKGEYRARPATGIEEELPKVGTKVRISAEPVKSMEPDTTAVSGAVTGKPPAHDFEDVTLKKQDTCKFCKNKTELGTCLRCKGCHMIIHKKCEDSCKQTACEQKIWPDEDVVADQTKDEPVRKEAKPDKKVAESAQKKPASSDRRPSSATPSGTTAADDRKFFKSLEMTDDTHNLNAILEDLDRRDYSMRMYAVASHQAKFLHQELNGEERLNRVHNVYQKVKVVFERERQQKGKLEAALAAATTSNAKSEIVAKLTQCDKRIKHLNLVLLYYACGLKHLYAERHETTSDMDNEEN